jgi:hypothetical protein
MIGESMFEESNLRIGYIICFVTAVGFVCSLTYNHGYFWLCDAGINILSIGDILTSYTLWIPSLGTLLFGYGLDLFLKHLEDKEKSKKIKKLLKYLVGLPQTLVFIAITILLFSYLMFDLPYIPVLLWVGFCFVWLKISGHLLASKIFSGRTNKFILGIFLFVPVILSLMFTIGFDQALKDSKLHTPNAFLTQSYQAKTIPTIILRHLEKGLLTKDIINNNYVVYIWRDVSKVEIISNNAAIKGV